MSRGVCILAACLALATAAPARAQLQVPELFEQVGFEQRLGMALPLDLEFQDQSGQTVRLGRYFGAKPVVLTLVYYECPAVCIMALDGLIRASKAVPFDVGKEYEVVTVSFNPEETPKQSAEKKAEAVRRYNRPGAADGWHFLTGSPESIRRLTQTVGFRYVKDPASGEYAHTTGLVVLTPEGRIARYFYGVEYSARDLRWALVEASENKIGSAIDQLMMLCYRYDPATGRYGSQILLLLQAACVLTVVGLFGYIGVSLAKERVARRR